jgi:hypothetical protein
MMSFDRLEHSYEETSNWAIQVQLSRLLKKGLFSGQKSPFPIIEGNKFHNAPILKELVSYTKSARSERQTDRATARPAPASPGCIASAKG